MEFYVERLAKVSFDQEKNIVHIVFLKNNLTPEDVRKIIDTIIEKVPSKKFGVISDFREIDFVSRDTRHEFAEYKTEYVIAAAGIYKSILIRGLGNLFLKFGNPKYPTQFFNSFNLAEKWLIDRIKEYERKKNN